MTDLPPGVYRDDTNRPWLRSMEELWYKENVTDKATESTVRQFMNSIGQQVSQNKLIALVRFINKDGRGYYEDSKAQAEMLSDMKMEDKKLIGRISGTAFIMDDL